METTAIFDVQQLVGNYAHRLETGFDALGSEARKDAGENATRIFDMEESLTVMNAVLAGVLSAVDKRLRAVAERKVPFNLGQTVSARARLAELLVMLSSVDVALMRAEHEGYKIQGTQELRENRDGAKSLLAELEKVVRPVRVEQDGQLFETSGEPMSLPGFEPAVVLRALADLKAGRTRSLKDIIASKSR